MSRRVVKTLCTNYEIHDQPRATARRRVRVGGPVVPQKSCLYCDFLLFIIHIEMPFAEDQLCSKL